MKLIMLILYSIVEGSAGSLRADHRLRNDLLDEIKSMNIAGWTRDNVSTSGE